MTLVVARVTPLGVRVAVDMRITDPSATRTGFLHAALKIILLSPTLCVAYSGNVGAALGAIRRMASQGVDAEGARLHLLDAHLRSRPGADFLIASLRPERLVAVKHGRAEDSVADWLGERGAFTEYQRYYHGDQHQPAPDFYDSAERAREMDIATRMGAGMQAVVYGPSVVVDGDTRTVTRPLGGSHPTVGRRL